MRRCIVRFLSRGSTRGFSITRNVNEKRTRVARRARHAGPQKPPFLACQKVAPPPCKKPPFLHFPRRKACIFDRFVHENAHFWHLFCGHSSRPMGCQSVGKKPANLYSTKCRIFGPRTPPPVAPWWDTSSRRPHTGSRTPISYFAINCKNEILAC
jgi:hypothetical protein